MNNVLLPLTPKKAVDQFFEILPPVVTRESNAEILLLDFANWFFTVIGRKDGEKCLLCGQRRVAEIMRTEEEKKPEEEEKAKTHENDSKPRSQPSESNG